MANQAGTATGVVDLMTKLASFATVGLGWTVNYNPADRLFLSYSPTVLFPSFRWDATPPGAGARYNVGIFHGRQFGGTGFAPGDNAHLDSGQGIVSGVNATIATGRHAPLINGSMNYWFFGATNGRYVHVVAQTDVADFVHFGFGSLVKISSSGSWTGGEYVYGHAYNAANEHGAAIELTSSHLLDALCDAAGGAPFRASLRMKFIPDQGASEYGVVGNFATSGVGTDRGGATRSKVRGGFRGGFTGRAQGRYGADTHVGLAPMHPILIGANTTDGGGANNLYLLGTMRDVRALNVQFLEPGETFIYGPDTWMAFPTKRKSGDDVAGSAAGSSYFSGVAYKVF